MRTAKSEDDPDENSKPDIKSLFRNKAYSRLLPFIAIYWIAYIQNAVVMPAYGAAWFAGCDESDDDCNFDYTKYNFWHSLTISLRGLLGFLFAGFVGSLSDSYGRKPFILIQILICCVNYATLAIFGNLLTWFILNGVDGLFSSSQALNATMTAYVSDTISDQNLKTIGFSIVLAILALNVLLGTGLGALISIIWNAETVFVVEAIGFGIAALYCLVLMPETVSDENGNKRRLNWNSLKNPFEPLTYINSHPLILYLGLTAFFSQMITSSIAVTIIYINDQMNINESNLSVIMNMLLFLSMSISGIVIAGFIVPCLKTKVNTKDVTLIIGSFSILIVSSLVFSILSFITDKNGDNSDVEVYCIIIVVGGSILLGSYALLETTIKSIIGQFVNDNEQGVAFGVIQAMQNLMIVIGPFTFGYGYNLIDEELGFPALLYFIISGLLFIALFVAIGPLRRIVNKLEESNEKFSIIKSKDTNDDTTSLLEMDATEAYSVDKSVKERTFE